MKDRKECVLLQKHRKKCWKVNKKKENKLKKFKTWIYYELEIKKEQMTKIFFADCWNSSIKASKTRAF